MGRYLFRSFVDKGKEDEEGRPHLERQLLYSCPFP